MLLTPLSKKISAIVVAGAMALAVTGCQQDAAENEVVEIVRPVRAMKITDAGELRNRYFVGTARAAREVSLSFSVSGTLTAITAAIGEDVQEGQLVATINPATYQAEVDRLSADLESAVATYENARDQTERQRKLFDKGHVAQAALDRANSQERSTRASIASVQGALDKASLNLSYTQLYAPFNGIVVAKYAEDFEEVSAQSQVLRILDGEHIEMVIDVPERYIYLVEHIEEVHVTFDAISETKIPATVTEVGTEASSTTRTFPVTLRMEQPDKGRVLPGMTGRASGHVSKAYDPFANIVIPPTSVFVPEGGTEPHVWIVDPATNTVSARQVAVGAPRSQGLGVNSGLKAEDIIVTAGANSLREGQEVALTDIGGIN